MKRLAAIVLVPVTAVALVFSFRNTLTKLTGTWIGSPKQPARR